MKTMNTMNLKKIYNVLGNDGKPMYNPMYNGWGYGKDSDLYDVVTVAIPNKFEILEERGQWYLMTNEGEYHNLMDALDTDKNENPVLRWLGKDGKMHQKKLKVTAVA